MARFQIFLLRMTIIQLIFCFCWFSLSISDAQTIKQHINIHVVPHSHVDPMWKSSPHEYSKNTNKILEGVVLSLIQNPNRTFIWESIFFLDIFFSTHSLLNVCEVFSSQQIEREKLRNWCGSYVSNLDSQQQSLNPLSSSSSSPFVSKKLPEKCCTMKEAFINLLQKGQLELVGGGWVSHDETLSDFESKLDNYAIGRRWIAKELGIQHLPSTSWNIDSFGHTTSNAGIVLGLNYTSQVLNRVPYGIKNYIQTHGPHTFRYVPERTSHKFQFYNSPPPADPPPHPSLPLITSILPFHYSSPDSIDQLLHSRHLSRSKQERIQFSLIHRISSLMRDCSSHLKTRDCDIMILVGNDMTYAGSAPTVFYHLDSVIKNLNAIYERNDEEDSVGRNGNSLSLRGLIDQNGYKLRLFYSTPKRCFDDKNSQEQLSKKRKEETDQDKDKDNEKINEREKNSMVIEGKGHFVPYSDSLLNDWTGYYGSRPQLKARIRYFETSLHRIESFVIGLILSCKSQLRLNLAYFYSTLSSFYQKYGLSTHHDTLTGTSQRLVIEKYHHQLNDDIAMLYAFVEQLLAGVLQSDLRRAGINNQNDVKLFLGDHNDERDHGIVIEVGKGPSSSSGRMIYFLDWQRTIQRHSSLPFHLNLNLKYPLDNLDHLCVLSSPYLSSVSIESESESEIIPDLHLQLLHNYELSSELECDPTKKCPVEGQDGHDMVELIDTSEIDKWKQLMKRNQSFSTHESTQQEVTKKEMRLLVRSNHAHKRNEMKNEKEKSSILPYLSIQRCQEDDKSNTGGTRLSRLKSFSHGHHSPNPGLDPVKSRDDDRERKILERLIPYLSIRTLTSGVGWHSSGAYLLRTPFNALLTGIVHFTLGFVTSFVCFLFYVLCPQLFNGLYRRISQTILSSTWIKNTFYKSKSDDSIAVPSREWNSTFSSTLSRFCSMCQKITPVVLLFVCFRVSIGFLLLTWIYLQTPFFWSLPILPYHSFINLYFQAFLSAPYLVGFLLNIWITSVVSVVLYSTTSSLNHNHSTSPSSTIRRISSFSSSSSPPPSPSPSPLPIPPSQQCFSSVYSLLAPYFTTLLFIWIVYISILLSSLISFFLSPEYQSFSSPSLCLSPLSHSSSTTPTPTWDQINSSFSPSSSSFPIRFQSGPILSELIYLPCVNDPSILISIRKYHHKEDETKENKEEEEDLEIEILSRVSSGNDLLLRVDLDYWEKQYLTKSNLENEIIRYEGVSNDGWWGLIREYEWFTPLSANFLPISKFLTLRAYSSSSSSSSSSSMWFSSLISSLFPTYLITPSPQDISPTSSQPSPHFSLFFTPLYPTGMVQYNNKLECLIHRSHLVDDEKGLEEGLYDPSRGRYLIQIKYKESSRRGENMETTEEKKKKKPDPLALDKTIDQRDGFDIQSRHNDDDNEEDESVDERHLVVVSSVDDHKYLHLRLTSIAHSLRELEERSLRIITEYLRSLRVNSSSLSPDSETQHQDHHQDQDQNQEQPNLNFDVDLKWKLKKLSLISSHEVCVLVGSSSSPSHLSQFHSQLSSHGPLCTLDCLSCPWEKGLSYFVKYGLVAFRISL